jgi:hypothetical protein
MILITSKLLLINAALIVSLCMSEKFEGTVITVIGIMIPVNFLLINHE